MSIIKRGIKKIIGLEQINKLKYQLGFIYNNKFIDLKTEKKIFYMLVPTHGNLGDQAIAYASRKFLENNFKDYKVIEINMEDTYKYSKAIKSCINKDDLIFLHGGGNMGNHYIREEESRRHIINTFKNNKIISFTQTIYFSNDNEGKKELNQTKKVYNSHDDLTIIAREEKSYNMMKSEFTNVNILKSPDIVFYLNNKINISTEKRINIMTCLRKDKETYISINKKEDFLNKLKDNFEDIIITDTVVDYSVSQDEREKELVKLWTKFYNSKVVITDRLHGMIFCAITKTPCIVTRSLDHKVIESYKWIKDLNYIRLVDGLNFDEIKSIIEELSTLDQIDEFDFDSKYFNRLRGIIENE